MKRFRLAMLTLFVLVTAIPLYAYALDIAKITKELPQEITSEVSRIPQKPHFLVGLAQPNNAWDKFQELRKMHRTVAALYEPRWGSLIDRSAPDYVADTMLQDSVVVDGKKVQIIYLGYHRLPDGMTVLWHKLGEKNLAEFSPLYEKYKARWAIGLITDVQWEAIKKILGWAQFESVKSHLHKVLADSASANSNFYKSFGFLRKVIEKREQVLNDPGYGQKLNDPARVLDGVRLEEIIPVPHTDVKDFLPDLFLVGLGKFEGGIAYWRLPETERIAYVHLVGIMREYIVGKNDVTRHELTHSNPYLQNTIQGLYIDHEVWAEMATGLLSGDFLNFLFHSYIVHWQDLVKINFGYDTDEVKRRLFPGQFGEIGLRDINRKEFEENSAKVETIVQELRKFVELLLIEYYYNPLLWQTINTKFCDNAAALRINFALQYEPAGLFDPDKKDRFGKPVPPSVQTREWLMKEEEAGRIQRLADYAMAETGKATKGEEKFSKLRDKFNIKCPVDSKFFLLPPEERNKIVAWGEALWKQAQLGDVVARVMLRRAFGNLEMLHLLKTTTGEEGLR